jgi:hypothetical protein
MTTEILREVEDQQKRYRVEEGRRPDDTDGEDSLSPTDWYNAIFKRNEHAAIGLPADRRTELVKVAALAVSAIEALDRRQV